MKDWIKYAFENNNEWSNFDDKYGSIEHNNNRNDYLN